MQLCLGKWIVWHVEVADHSFIPQLTTTLQMLSPLLYSWNMEYSLIETKLCWTSETHGDSLPLAFHQVWAFERSWQVK